MTSKIVNRLIWIRMIISGLRWRGLGDISGNLEKKQWKGMHDFIFVIEHQLTASETGEGLSNVSYSVLSIRLVDGTPVECLGKTA